tara:strand:- start:175 stop:387 length:213 start_codon:yes stop_codon:yes gene_type:complete
MKPTQIPPGGWSEVTFGKTFSWLTLSNRFLGGGFATDTTCFIPPFKHQYILCLYKRSYLSDNKQQPCNPL